MLSIFCYAIYAAIYYFDTPLSAAAAPVSLYFFAILMLSLFSSDAADDSSHACLSEARCLSFTRSADVRLMLSVIYDY